MEHFKKLSDFKKNSATSCRSNQDGPQGQWKSRQKISQIQVTWTIDISRSNMIWCLCIPHKLLVLNGTNMWPKPEWPWLWPLAYSAVLRDLRLQTLSKLDFDLSMSVKVKCDSAIAFPKWFLLLPVFIVTYPLAWLLYETQAFKMSDVASQGHSRSKCDGAIRFPMYYSY